MCERRFDDDDDGGGGGDDDDNLSLCLRYREDEYRRTDLGGHRHACQPQHTSMDCWAARQLSLYVNGFLSAYPLSLTLIYLLRL